MSKHPVGPTHPEQALGLRVPGHRRREVDLPNQVAALIKACLRAKRLPLSTLAGRLDITFDELLNRLNEDHDWDLRSIAIIEDYVGEDVLTVVPYEPAHPRRQRRP